jgi:hypothetical protein
MAPAASGPVCTRHEWALPYVATNTKCSETVQVGQFLVRVRAAAQLLRTNVAQRAAAVVVHFYILYLKIKIIYYCYYLSYAKITDKLIWINTYILNKFLKKINNML